MTKKIRKCLALLGNIRVEHLLYSWFFSVLGFLILLLAFGYASEFELDDAWSGKNILFSLSLYGFMILGALSFSFALLLFIVNTILSKKLSKIAKSLFLFAVLFIFGIIIYRVGFSEGETSVVCEFTVDKKMCEQVLSYDDEQSRDDTQEIPACDFNGCPEYKAIDTDGDNRNESVVYKRIAMTKGAGEVLIIDEGKVVFRAGGAQFSYEENDDMPGITVSYVKEFDETGLNPKTWEREKWIYLSGEYVLADDYEGFCEEYLDLETNDNTIISLEGNPIYPDYTFEEEAGKFRTAIDKAIGSGANYAGHYTIATWGCGTDCFGYAVADLLSGEIVTFSPANENYNISGLDVNGRYMVFNPVSAGQDKKYYKLSEYRNYSDEIVSIFNLACTETSTQDMYGTPE